MKKFILILILIFNCFLICSKEVMLLIKDKDIDIPLEGAKVLDKTDNKIYTADKNGKVTFSVKDDLDRIIVTVSLIGYESKSANIKDFDKEIEVKLLITGTLEGKELVIEGKSESKNEQLGVSKFIDKGKLRSFAERGIIEDVFSALKNLPGVNYTGRFNTNLSVRGGDPDELATVYDGFLIRYPLQWGGTVSIFDPNVVDSVEFSPGIFSAKYGYGTSGLVEINSYKPENGVHLNTDAATAAFDAFVQTPLGLKDSGLLFGTRIAFTDLANLLNTTINNNTGILFSVAPYIRNGYLKWYWKPFDRFEWYVNGFIGTDGTESYYNGENGTNSARGIFTDFSINYSNLDTFGVTGFKYLPVDNIQMEFKAGYEYLFNNVNFNVDTHGSLNYTQDFINQFGPLLGGATSFTINDLNSNFSTQNTLHSIQTRYDVDFNLTDKITISAGLGGFYDFQYYNGFGNIWQTSYQSGSPVFERTNFTIDSENKRFLKYFGYLDFNFNIVPDVFSIEAGIRIDHLFIYAQSFNNGVLNFYPAPGPRLLISYSPFRNIGWIDKITFSTGAGLFCNMPLTENNSLSGNDKINDYQIAIPQVLETVLGLEFDLKYGFVFKVEGYYKFSYNRYYVNSVVSTTGSTTNYVHSDGIAHISGVEVSIDRKISKYIDGTISYSFIYARYYDPGTESAFTVPLNMMAPTGDPTGVWYYPSFHQFHKMNIELNIHPANFCTITPSFQLASGTPKPDYGSV